MILTFGLFHLLLLLVAVLCQNNDSGNGANLTATKDEKSKHDDYYTSLVGIQNLARFEQKIVRRIVRYRAQLQKRLELINLFVDDYRETIHSLIDLSSKLREKYAKMKFPIFKDNDDLRLVAETTSANPLMVFKLMRRFAKQLTDIAVDLLTKDTDSDYNFRKYIESIPLTLNNLPNEEDLNGAADGLLRLQETYQLGTEDMSNGILIDKKTKCSLTASDMQFIGIRAFNKRQFGLASHWLYFGLQRVLQGDQSFSRQILEDNLRFTSQYHNSVFISFQPGVGNLLSNLINVNFTNIPALHVRPLTWTYPLRVYANIPTDIDSYRALCRGEQLLTPQETKNLRCWYSHEKSPANEISPLKVELLLENPPVFQIYDLLSDKIIGKIKETAEPHLKRALVAPHLGGHKSEARTSSVSWITEKNHEIIKNLPHFVERATGLEIIEPGAAEELQVSCYGSVGGHYDPHLDPVIPDGGKPDYTRGDRIATIMFYLSDVELGGGTAFPKLGIASKPIKGSAVLWYNLRRNGEKERLMLHGGCPVLHGNKLVANKWIRINAQIHNRNCTLNQYE